MKKEEAQERSQDTSSSKTNLQDESSSRTDINAS